MAGAYLLTGSTGFVGQELLRQLASSRTERVYCLVRERQGRTASQRLQRALQKIGAAGDERFVAVSGDIAREDLGLAAEQRANLAREVGSIIHAAADVRFNQDAQSINATNVSGTRAILEFARSCRRHNPAFSHLSYLSTAFVAGRRSGVVDADSLEHDKGFKNTYEASKYDAEKVVRESMGDLPIIVFRPSIVLGSGDASRSQSRDLLYPLVVSFMHWPLPIIGQDDFVHIDFVPVDFVARAVLFLGERRENRGRTFHLAAGVGDDLSVADCAQVVAACCNRRIVTVPNVLWTAIVLPLLKRLFPQVAEWGADGLEFFGPYMDQENPQFSMAATDLALAGSGVVRPPLRQVLETSVKRALASAPLPDTAPFLEAVLPKLDRKMQAGLHRFAHAFKNG